MTAQDHELQRLRQEKNHQEGDDQGYSAAKIEHRPPAERRNQPGCDETAQHRTDIEGIGDRDRHRSTRLRGSIFPDQSEGIRHDAAKSHAGDESYEQELVDGIHAPCPERHDREE